MGRQAFENLLRLDRIPCTDTYANESGIGRNLIGIEMPGWQVKFNSGNLVQFGAEFVVLMKYHR